MKASILSIFAAAAALVSAQADGNAPGNTPRDRLAVVNGALMNVTHKIEDLGTALGNLTAENVNNSLASLLESSTAVVSAIEVGVENVGKVDPPLDIIGALFLTVTTDHLAEVVKKTVNVLLEQYSVIEKSGLKPIVYSQLQQQNQGSTDLTNAVKEKIPAEAGPIADTLIAPVNDALKTGLDSYADTSTGPAPLLGAATMSAASWSTFSVAAVAAIAIVMF